MEIKINRNAKHWSDFYYISDDRLKELEHYLERIENVKGDLDVADLVEEIVQALESLEEILFLIGRLFYVVGAQSFKSHILNKGIALPIKIEVEEINKPIKGNKFEC